MHLWRHFFVKSSSCLVNRSQHPRESFLQRKHRFKQDTARSFCVSDLKIVRNFILMQALKNCTTSVSKKMYSVLAVFGRQ